MAVARPGGTVQDSLLAIVPCKPFAEAKHRLAGVLDARARKELSRALLTRTLNVLGRARGVDRVAVVSRDGEVLRVARGSGAWAIWETSTGLNQALEQGTRVAQANGFGRVLILPTDLPQLTTSDLEAVIRLAQPSPCVVIAPAHRDSGTNALLVSPAGLIQYSFGRASFEEHRRAAEAVGARIEVFRSPGLDFDLDLPEDLDRLQAEGILLGPEP